MELNRTRSRLLLLFVFLGFMLCAAATYIRSSTLGYIGLSWTFVTTGLVFLGIIGLLAARSEKGYEFNLGTSLGAFLFASVAVFTPELMSELDAMGYVWMTAINAIVLIPVAATGAVLGFSIHLVLPAILLWPITAPLLIGRSHDEWAGSYYLILVFGHLGGAVIWFTGIYRNCEQFPEASMSFPKSSFLAFPLIAFFLLNAISGLSGWMFR